MEETTTGFTLEPEFPGPCHGIPGPTLESDADASYWLGRLNNYTHSLDTLKEQYSAMKADLERQQERTRRWCGPVLESYCFAKLQGVKTKTIDFLLGKCAFRANKGGAKIVDEDAAKEHAIRLSDTLLYRAYSIKDPVKWLHWAESCTNNELDAFGVQCEIKVKQDDYLALITPEHADPETGEIIPAFVPPGVEVTPAHEDFYINGKRFDAAPADIAAVDPDAQDTYTDPFSEEVA